MMELLIERASSYAKDIDTLILVITLIVGVWLLAAEFILFYFIIRFSRKKNPKAAYITGEEPLSKKWIHWPHNLVILCDIVIIVLAIRVWYVVKQDLPPADDKVRIIGQQWSWSFVHSGIDGKLGTEDDVEVVDELHVKVNQTYHFKLESKDVLHSFSVPVFRLKQDAVPGRVITGWFKPTKTGQFDIQCAEMCGIGHGVMVAKLFIHTDEEYDSWIESKSSKEVTKLLKETEGRVAKNK